MSDLVWVSGAMMDPRQMRPLTSDIADRDIHRAVDSGNRNDAGEALGPDCFPAAIWPSEYAVRSWNAMPDLFFAGSYWVISQACANVLRRFDLGNGALYPVIVFKKDRKTKLEGDYFCLNFGNVKHAFLPNESPNTRDWPGGRRALPFVEQDFDVAVSREALSGPDIWIDPFLTRSFFISGPLGDALKAAKVSSWFKLKKCRVI